MEIKEHSETKLLEASQTKLNAAEVILKESKNFFGNVNNLNTEEEKEQSSANIASFLTPKQQRIWNHLSENKKKRYVAKTERTYNQRSETQGTNLKIKEEKGQLHTKDQKTTIGKQGAKAGKNAAKKGAAESMATGVGSAATGGALLAGEAVKKTADKFKESLTQRAAAQAESFKQLEDKMKGKKKSQAKTNSLEGSGNFLALVAGAFIGVILLAVFPLIVALLLISATGVDNQKIVDVARAELEVAEYNIGGTTYKEWYGLDADWCAMFVSWCGNECGYIENGIMVKSASVQETKDWYEEQNLYQSKESGYAPDEGDIIFFLNGMSHVGIVVSYNAELDEITVIEGNSGISLETPYHAGSRVTQNVYPRTAESISGYGTPDYPETEDAEAESGEDANEQIE